MTQEKQRTAAGLAVKNLTVAYGSRTVLDNVAFTLPAGASLAIVGESGCGKTTLANIIALTTNGVLKNDAAHNSRRAFKARGGDAHLDGCGRGPGFPGALKLCLAKPRTLPVEDGGRKPASSL